jgi:tetratricopeptide (TPR) repeat protein
MLTTYVNSLIANKEEKELFSFYENFVSRFDTKNIVESLNNYYENNYELNWYNLKNDFSTMANNVSWYVVDNKISDPAKIKKAIEWSEMSLKLSRNNSYYMDTLAQLYYKNGDKQKAILTQEDAIKNYKDAEVNPDTLTEMKNVLEKMKSW